MRNGETFRGGEAETVDNFGKLGNIPHPPFPTLLDSIGSKKILSRRTQTALYAPPSVIRGIRRSLMKSCLIMQKLYKNCKLRTHTLHYHLNNT